MKNKKGSALIFSLIILSLVVVSSLTIASTTLTQRSASIVTGQSTAAFQNADRGMEILLQQIYNNLSPLDTLDDLAAELGMTCDDPSGGLSATSEDFSIVATAKSGLTVDCDMALADVERFKIVGEHKQAARALQIRMQDSLKRGLLAYWNFEDNAEALRLDYRYPGAPAVADASRHDHILTLCPEDQDNHGFTSFGACPQIEDENEVAPVPTNPDDIQGIYMDHGGAELTTRAGNTVWKVNGVIDEKLPPYGSESIAFNGTSHYLAMNTETSGPNAVSSNNLGIDQAVSISLWIRPQRIASATGQRIILENRDGSRLNYGLYLNDSDEIVFQLGNSTTKQITSNAVSLGDWHHILVMWDYSLTPKRAHLFVDGEEDTMTYGGTLTRDTDTIWVGGSYSGTNPDIFTVADFSEGYRGRMDDIRIYDRGLTAHEMESLCLQAHRNRYTVAHCDRF